MSKVRRNFNCKNRTHKATHVTGSFSKCENASFQESGGALNYRWFDLLHHLDFLGVATLGYKSSCDRRLVKDA